MAMRKHPIVIGIAALAFSGYLSALGLGEIRLNSALNEPLDAEVPLINLGELSQEEILAGLASSTDFANANVDRELVHSSLKFNLDLGAPGGPVLRITTQKPIREPYLDFLVDLQWPSGRVLREYTLLLDLPVYAGGTFQRPQSSSSRGPVAGSTRRAVEEASSSRDSVTAGSGEYVVRSGDTLWRIASSMGGAASVYDKMADIRNLNPDAFIDGDINLIKRGAILRMPSYAGDGVNRSLSRSQSGSGERDAPAGGRSTGSAVPQSETSGRLSLTAESGGAAVSGVGEGTGGSSPSRGELDIIQDELARTQRENSQLKNRLASLEEQLITVQRLLKLEDDEMRAAQLARLADEADSPDAPDEAETDDSAELESSPSLALFPSASEDERTRSDEEVDLTQQDADETIASTSSESPLQEQVSPSQTETSGAPESVGKASAPMKMETKTKTGWMDAVSGYWAYIVGALILIGGGILFFLRWRNRADSDEYQAASDFAPPPPRDRQEPRFEEPAGASSLEEIDLDEGDDLFAPEEDSKPDVAVAPAEPSPEEIELDLSEFDLDDDVSDAGVDQVSSASEEEVEHLNLDDEFDFLGDVDEADTQLELAQAYIEMGDSVGAREILGEVLEGGSEEQKAKAQALLDQIG